MALGPKPNVVPLMVALVVEPKRLVAPAELASADKLAATIAAPKSVRLIMIDLVGWLELSPGYCHDDIG